MDRKQILIEKAVDGILSDQDQLEYNDLVASDPEFARAVKLRNEVGSFIKINSTNSFSPFFVDQLLKGISNNETSRSRDSLLQSLLWSFKRVAFASAFVVLVLVGLNAISSSDSQQSFVEKAFDIPAVSIDVAQEDFGFLIP